MLRLAGNRQWFGQRQGERRNRRAKAAYFVVKECRELSQGPVFVDDRGRYVQTKLLVDVLNPLRRHN
ncbi:MAG: hypothetical protein MJA27_36260 [Pseudanabaenales cyanobacterium]|nr:hypothetical protein [Pseudanabaenales cyanobacterium]